MSEPRQKPGSSKQDFGTPDPFLAAVVARYGPIHIDLAATEENRVVPWFIGPNQDTLKTPWPNYVRRFLNNEFGDTARYVEKCAAELRNGLSGVTIQLIPASIGTVWFAKHCEGIAEVVAIRPRLVFKGSPINPKTNKQDPYPKDLMLLIWGGTPGRLSTWAWNEPFEGGFHAECMRWRKRPLLGFGAHYCPDWDDIPIDETTHEWEACTCPIKKIHQERNVVIP